MKLLAEEAAVLAGHKVVRRGRDLAAVADARLAARLVLHHPEDGHVKLVLVPFGRVVACRGRGQQREVLARPRAADEDVHLAVVDAADFDAPLEVDGLVERSVRESHGPSLGDDPTALGRLDTIKGERTAVGAPARAARQGRVFA